MEGKDTAKGNVTCTMKATFPSIGSFKEWDEDCKKNFNDCRWMKLMYDHKMSKEMANISRLVEEIEMMNIRLDKLEEKIENKKDSGKNRLTMGKNGVMI